MQNNHILLDPYVIAIPTSPRERPEYVAALVGWLRVLVRNRQRCSVSERSLAEMWSSGRYPTRLALGRVIAEAELQDVSVVDVMNLLRPVSETEPFLEQHVGIGRVAGGEWVFVPDVVIDRLGQEIGSAFREAIVMAILAQERGWAPDGLIVATGDVEARDGHAGAALSIAELLSGELEEVDRTVAGEFELIDEPDNAEADVTLEDVYSDPGRATVIAYRLQVGSGAPELNPERIAVGDDFLRSLERLNIHRSVAVLRSLYRRIARAAMGDLHLVEGAQLHAVRESENADAPQVTRGDGAALWRCMVTKRGAGYRLHYWTLVDGRIEIDRVRLESEV